MRIEADSHEDWPDAGDWPAIAGEAVRAAFTADGHHALLAADKEVSVRFGSDEEVRALNAAWRGKDRPTNVLSFPMVSRDRLADPAEPMLGDIILAARVCAAEAEEQHIALADHAAHLIVHGALHLAGHDHADDEMAEAMEAAERRALHALGIADPYRFEKA